MEKEVWARHPAIATSFCIVLELMTVPSLRERMTKGGGSSEHEDTTTWSGSVTLASSLHQDTGGEERVGHLMSSQPGPWIKEN